MRADAESFQLVKNPISAHAFNADRSQVALCPNNNELHIYTRTPTGWSLTHTLTDHTSLITGIDWAPRTNRIVTCSQDRNAYVWSYLPLTHTWKPQLVLLRIQRAATCVSFSPNESKIAVGTGGKVVAICHYEKEEDWWVSKHLKKVVGSTVLSLRWHWNGVLVAVGCADGTALVLSAFVKGVDEKPDPSPWGDRLPFNHVCLTQPSPYRGFVHDVAFSPSGQTLAFTAHDSTINFVSPPHGMVTVEHEHEPFKRICWVKEDKVVVAGFEGDPFLVTLQNGQWTLVGKIETGSSPMAARKTGSSGAFAKFRQLDSKAQSQSLSSSRPAAGRTLHQNTITCMKGYEADKLSLTGLDGKLSILDFSGVPDLGRLTISA